MRSPDSVGSSGARRLIAKTRHATDRCRRRLHSLRCWRERFAAQQVYYSLEARDAAFNGNLAAQKQQVPGKDRFGISTERLLQRRQDNPEILEALLSVRRF